MSILPKKDGEYTVQLRARGLPDRDWTGTFFVRSGHWYPPSPDYTKWNVGYLDAITPVDEDPHGRPKEVPGAREYKVIAVGPPLFRYREAVHAYLTDALGTSRSEAFDAISEEGQQALLDSLEGEVCRVVDHNGTIGVLMEVVWPLPDDKLYGDLKQEMLAMVRDYRRRFAEDFPEVEIYAAQGDQAHPPTLTMRAFAPLGAKMKSSEEYRKRLKEQLFSTVCET